MVGLAKFFVCVFTSKSQHLCTHLHICRLSKMRIRIFSFEDQLKKRQCYSIHSYVTNVQKKLITPSPPKNQHTSCMEVIEIQLVLELCHPLSPAGG